MEGYTGYWEDSLTFSPLPEYEDAFLQFGSLSLLVENRTILLYKDPKGSNPCKHIRERNAGLGLRYRWYITSQPWARWMHSLTELKVEDDHLTFEVVPDHELPWPVLKFSTSVLDAAIAKREIRLRFKSAFEINGEIGLKQTIRDMPECFRRNLTPPTWMSILQEVRYE